MTKKKRITMKRMHVSLPAWLFDRMAEIAEADGRTLSELTRRLFVNHIRREDQSAALPNASRLGSWKRAAKSLDGLPKKGGR